MSKFLKVATALALISTPAVADTFGLGRTALPEEIAAWDKDVRPDGTGLPDGSGDVLTGEEVFADQCAVCHGDFAEGVDNWPKLAGGAGTLADEDPLKTVGSYWPYLSTAWDYVNRSMPFGNAQTLDADEVYAIVAYILYSNDLVDEDFVLSNETFADVELPNHDGFILDNRLETEHSKWVGEPCMENCKEDVKVTMRAMVLDVTPDEGKDEPAPAMVEDAPVVEETKVEEAPVEEVVALDPELVAAGAKVFKKCKACHQVGDGAKNKTGPVLNGIIGQAAGAVEGFKYSKALKAKAEGGLVWTDETLAEFLRKPKAFMKGTKMSFAGLKKEKDLAAITAYLTSLGN
ncbi:sulfur dehydrogenase subunit SoxD [Litoreibacter meonggei]|uniref:Sulfur dehydrogenase subunit SoxD n=1 Tax=Litoreibacter meonggei TaxID=1049199 RepID=A0A497VL01_9RHOB|nr:c-type cytochrome [Litoreibacter meonggei]RLJ40895.1 sulfur dehydrogenase subunit SoxD [Litoreibacter meonggei]